MKKQKSDIYFVTGTDTGIGKTVCSLIIMQYLYYRGYHPFYLKPFQTGCQDVFAADSDALFIYSNIKELETKDPGRSLLYCFENPKAPFFAARDKKQIIKEEDFTKVKRTIEELQTHHNPVIVEGAGGLLVPLNESHMIIDFISLIKAKPILIASAGLGTINHTLLSIEVLASRGMKPEAILLSDGGEISTSEVMINENIEAIEKFSGCKVNGVIGKSEIQNQLFQKFIPVLDGFLHRSNIE